MGDENGNLDYERYYPSKQFQLLWIQEYLRGINNVEGKNNEPSQAEVTEYKWEVFETIHEIQNSALT